MSLFVRLKSDSESLHLRHRRSAAYTLIEIMLVLGIISVLVGASIYLLVGNLDVAKEQRVDTDIQAITTQLKVYEMQNYTFPTTAQGLKALVTRPTDGPQPRRWKQLLESVPLDPWGTPYQYEFPSKEHPETYEIYSWGPDRRNSEDDVHKSK